MARIPVDAKYSKMILSAARSGCLAEIVALVSVLTAIAGGRSIFRRHKDDEDEYYHGARNRGGTTAMEEASSCLNAGDHIAYLTTFARFLRACERKQWASQKLSREKWAARKRYSLRVLDQAAQIYRQLTATCKSLGLFKSDAETVLSTTCPDDKKREAIIKAIISGNRRSIAGRGEQTSTLYTCLWTDKSAELRRDSFLGGNPQLVVYDEFLVTRNSYLNIVSAVEYEWLDGPAKGQLARQAKERKRGEERRMRRPRLPLMFATLFSSV